MTPERFARLRQALQARQPDLTVLMQRVNKSHNFSAILRNCDAVGALEAHLIPPRRGVDLHPAISGGSAKWVDVHAHASVEDAVAHLKGRGFRILAAHPGEGARDFREVDLTGPTAFMVGAELFGISDRALALADQPVVIPMAGLVRSLNVSVATALLLFEAKRQREAAGLYDRPRLAPDEVERRLFEWAWPDVAERCREAALPYPPMGPDGELLEGPEL